MAKTYRLQDCEQTHRASPRSFSIPRSEIRRAIEPGWQAKLVFLLPTPIDGCRAEKMWVEVLRREGAGYTGRLVNQPRYLSGIARDDEVAFGPHHVGGLSRATDAPLGGLAGVGVDVLRRDAWPAWIAKVPARGATDSGWRVFSDQEAARGATVRGVSCATLFRAFAVTDSVIAGDAEGVFRWDADACEYVRVDALPQALRAAAGDGLGRVHRPLPDLDRGAVITRRVLDEAPIAAQRVKPPVHRPQDSGWCVLVGDESQAYLDDADNSTVTSLGHLLHRYPYLERLFGEDAVGMWDWDDAIADWKRDASGR